MSLHSCARPLRTTPYALICQTFCQPSPHPQVTLFDFIALLHHPAHAFTGTKRAFNPHNSTRPPQPPAATFLPEAFPIKPSDLNEAAGDLFSRADGSQCKALTPLRQLQIQGVNLL